MIGDVKLETEAGARIPKLRNRNAHGNVQRRWLLRDTVGPSMGEKTQRLQWSLEKEMCFSYDLQKRVYFWSSTGGLFNILREKGFPSFKTSSFLFLLYLLHMNSSSSAIDPAPPIAPITSVAPSSSAPDTSSAAPPTSQQPTTTEQLPTTTSSEQPSTPASSEQPPTSQQPTTTIIAPTTSVVNIIYRGNGYII